MKTIVVERKKRLLESDVFSYFHRMILTEFLHELHEVPSNHWVAKLFISYIELEHDHLPDLNWQLTILDGNFQLYNSRRPDIYAREYPLCDPRNIEMIIHDIKALISHKAEEFLDEVRRARRQ